MKTTAEIVNSKSVNRKSLLVLSQNDVYQSSNVSNCDNFVLVHVSCLVIIYVWYGIVLSKDDMSFDEIRTEILGDAAEGLKEFSVAAEADADDDI